MNSFLKFRFKSGGQSAVIGSFLAAATVAFGVVGPATTWADDLKAKPFEFVGTATDCAPSAAGSHIVTARWLKGLGLPDNGLANSNGADPTNNPNKNDPHFGLLLSKNGPTPDCSAAGATIKGVKGMIVDADSELGFDYRQGSHCGAGAPRFNVDTDKGFFFVGCVNAPHSSAPQDPSQWTRIRSKLTTCGSECFNATLGVPGSVPVGAKIKSIDIIFDEGTDTANEDTLGVGLAVIDNIDINGVLIPSNHSVKEGHHNGKDDDDDDDDKPKSGPGPV